jgi:hypothetical protein
MQDTAPEDDRDGMSIVAWSLKYSHQSHDQIDTSECLLAEQTKECSSRRGCWCGIVSTGEREKPRASIAAKRY